jgi:murein DD-endopeptidase MepM/ murein hydrolase activator NlpD
MSAPSGPITTKGFSGISWEDITRYDGFIAASADPVGWPIDRIRGTIAIESGGDPDAIQKNTSNGFSYGLMQIVPYGVGWAGWHSLVAQKAGLGRNYTERQIVQALYDPETNIAVGVAILESFYQQHGTLDKASSAFFLGNPNWRGQDTVNGNTGTWYRDSLNALIAEQKTFAPPDLISYIVSGAKYTAEFGFLKPNYNVNGVPQNYYHYGVGHGTSAPHIHTGVDIVIPMYTPLRTPLAGVVRCIGDAGSGDWGQGCGSFPDTIGGGIGNVTILTDVGYKLTFGHVNSSTLRVGARVAAGDVVARSGGMVGPHLHLDVTEKRNGTYWLLDPIPTIAKALGQAIPTPPPTYADPRPLPQARDWDVSVTVVATRDGVPVLSRAALDAAPANKPLAKGDDFEAVAQVLGNDLNIYWVSSRGSRVPVEGTSAPEWKGFNLDVTCPPPVVCPPPVDLSWVTDAVDTLEDLEPVLDQLRRSLESIEPS